MLFEVKCLTNNKDYGSDFITAYIEAADEEACRKQVECKYRDSHREPFMIQPTETDGRIMLDRSDIITALLQRPHS